MSFSKTRVTRTLMRKRKHRRPCGSPPKP